MSQSMTAMYLQNPALAQAIRRQQFGQSMLAQGSDASPVQHPVQGLARLAQALMGGYLSGRADDEIKAVGEKQDADTAAAMELAYGGGQMPQMAPQPTSAPPTAPRQPVAQQALAPEQYAPLIAQAAKETGIPENILTGLFAQESGFRPDARNPRSTATGIGQVLDSTAANPGYGLPPLSPEARLDPAQAIPWSARYLAARGQSLGVTDWTNPQQAERALRAYGENTPEYAQAVMRRAGMGAAPQGGETIPASMPGQGEVTPTQGPGGPQIRTPDATAMYLQQAERLSEAAMRVQRTNPALAGVLMQRAQMAQQLAMARGPQPSENERLLEAAGYRPGTPEYQQMARQLLERKGLPPTTNVNVPGNIPPGYQMRRVPGQDGADTYVMEPIPGGPADRAVKKEDKAEGKREESKVLAGGIVIEDIGRIEQQLKDAWLPATGIGAGTLSNIPGTAAADVARLLDGIKGNIAFDKLRQMREQSPTGAALGAVSDREMALLQSTLGSLEQSQSEKQFRENLTRLRKIYLDIVHGPGQWTETDPGSPPAPPPGFVPVPAR